MSAYRPKGRQVFVAKVPQTRTGKLVWSQFSCGTRAGAIAKKMQRMLDDLGPAGARAFDVLNRVGLSVDAGGLALASLWDLWVAVDQDLEALRARLEDVDLSPLVDEWHTALTGPRADISADTANHYCAAVRSLIVAGAPFLRSALTSERCEAWIDSFNDISPSTVRKKGQGMRSFCSWLKKRGVLSVDPMRDVELPAQGKPRVHYLETGEAKRLADAQPWPYSAFSALLAGSGVDVSVALVLRVRDVDEPNREIRAAGTKTHTRDRIVRVADWAWPYMERLVSDAHPSRRLFESIPDRWYARDEHHRAIYGRAARGDTPAVRGLVEEIPALAGYTMRDQRHTYAVRAIRAGTPAELVARQLGHVDAVLVYKVYGRFAPSQEERDRWEKIAAAQDAEREKVAQERAAKAKRSSVTLSVTKSA